MLTHHNMKLSVYAYTKGKIVNHPNNSLLRLKTAFLMDFRKCTSQFSNKYAS